MWVVKLVCLATKDVIKVPCSKYEKSLLVEAGLGEKKASIPENASIEEFLQIIISQS